MADAPKVATLNDWSRAERRGDEQIMLDTELNFSAYAYLNDWVNNRAKTAAVSRGKALHSLLELVSIRANVDWLVAGRMPLWEVARLLELGPTALSTGGANLSATPPAKSSGETAKDYLFGWPAILGALGRKNDDEEKSRVRRLNDSPLHRGPIVISGQGGQPKAEKSKLIAWWNGLEDRFDEVNARERDSAASVADQHQHGRDAVVAPNIGGAVKKQRKGKQ